MPTAGRRLVLGLILIVPATAAGKDDAATDFFEKKVRPILVEHCYKCHAAGAKKLGGHLRLDSREAVLKGGDTGPALVPGKPEESLLVAAVRYDDDALKMPPSGKLPDAAIADLEDWVTRGAPHPRELPAQLEAAKNWTEILRTRRAWWSLQPVREPAPPPVRDAQWSSHPVDQFLFAQLESRGLTPAPAADPRTVLRRLNLVLTGLPPTPDDVAAFLLEYGAAPDRAIEKRVDALLASPHFGERWARHWMDVVRFTETHGNEWNYEVHHAWRYRDYLVRAINADVPYDQLVREHIAGDLLPQPRVNATEAFNESVIGTAFYRFGEANHDDCIGLRQIGYDLADNQIDTLTKAFQAMTVACARCHDHKLDAVSMRDYHALLGIVRSSRLVSHTIDLPDVNRATIAGLQSLKQDIRQELGSIWLHDIDQFPPLMVAARARQAKQPEPEHGLDPKRLEAWTRALGTEKPPLEDALGPWRKLSAAADVTAEWRALAARYTEEGRARSEFNQQHFVTFADFRPDSSAAHGWQVGGQGLRDGPSRSGDFAVRPGGDAVITSLFPAGSYTHTMSDRLTGTLRSPVLPPGKAHISFQVMGRRSSAVRLVSNNCQLNYKNYRALTSDDLTWITFDPPADRESLRTYAELMTLFDNPKFPDQLSALGGDPENYRLPWEQAAANPRSYFGVTRVVLHDVAEPPRADLGHVRRLLEGDAPATVAEAECRFAGTLRASIEAWRADRATDIDIALMGALLRHGLLSNSTKTSPRLDSLVAQYRQTEAALTPPRVVPGIADFGPGLAQPVLVRGDWSKPGDSVPRRYVEVLSPPGEVFSAAGSGRRELAQRISSADNPLTARVMANRVWHHLFGAGIVRTVDDFGHVGEQPTHPELLDYIAARFMADGWSLKRLVRSLVLTRAFQMSSRPSEAAREIDPQDRLLQHYPARRLDAEAIRDAIVATSGRLDASFYGPSVQPYRTSVNADRRLFPGPLDGAGRRSLYIKNNLMEAPHFLGAFDFPGGKVAQGRRDLTNVPAQALALLNDPFVIEQADVWAARLIHGKETVPQRIAAMFELALARPPTTEEADRVSAAVARLAELRGVAPPDVVTCQPVWRDVAHAFYNLKEFITIP
jgi:hypothetical protein